MGLGGPCPESYRRCALAERMPTLRWAGGRECLQLSNWFPRGDDQVWNFIGDGMAVKGIEGGMIEMRIALNGRGGDGKCHRNFY